VDVPRTERFDRLSYWDPSLPSPVAGKVPANACLYCADLRGQMMFVNDTGKYGRSQAPTTYRDFAPRFGFAYNATSKMVVRGGYGIFFAPSGFQAAGTTGSSGMAGFSTWNNVDATFDSGKTVNATLQNPFPQGFNFPKGRANGAATDLGYSIGDTFFDSYRIPYSQQWNLNIQHQLPRDMTIEAGYLGNRGLFLVDGDPGQSYSQVNPVYLSLGSHLLDQVSNPFYGILNAGKFTQSNIAYNQLLRPYPQYGDGVSAYRKPGAKSMYHAVTLRLDKRFSNGLSFLVSFTGGKLMDDSASAVGFLGPTGGSRLDNYNRHLEWAVSPQDVAKRTVASFVYDLPFGRGKAYLNGLSKPANFIASGWQVNGILTFQTGTPIIVTGAANSTNLFSGQRLSSTGINGAPASQNIDGWLTKAAFSQPATFTFGNLGRTLPNVRNPGQSNADISLFKNNYFGKESRYNVQFRSEWFNSLNHPQFSGPDTNIQSGSFGVINSTAVSARQIQMAVKFIF
jgi:hypothetical protein